MHFKFCRTYSQDVKDQMLAAATTLAGALVTKQVIKMLCQPRRTIEHFQQQQQHQAPIPYKDLLRSAIISRLAYEEPSKFREGIERVSEIDRTREVITSVLPYSDASIHFYDASIKTRGTEDTQAYMWAAADEVFLAFRGTEDKSDAMADIDVRTYKVADMRIHKGFYEQTEVVIKEILADFAKYKDIKQITIQGHSLGAACATIAALFFSKHYPDLKIALHTYGSPRVGNSKFADVVAEKVTHSWRIYNLEDPVAMIPMSFRFQHITGKALCMTSDLFDDSHEVYTKDAHWILRPLISYGCINMIRPIAAHDCQLYISKLENLWLEQQQRV